MCKFGLYVDAGRECGFYLYRAFTYPPAHGPGYGVVIGRGQYLYSANGSSLLEAWTKAMRKAELEKADKPRVVREKPSSDEAFAKLFG